MVLDRCSIKLISPAIGGHRTKKICALLVRHAFNAGWLWPWVSDDQHQHASIIAISYVSLRVRYVNYLIGVQYLPPLDDKPVGAR